MTDAGDVPGAVVCATAFGGAPGALQLRLPADAGAVRSALLRLEAELGAAGVAAGDVANAELILAEVLNNIVEHAFGAARDDAWIEMTIVPSPVGIGCELRDNGRPMPDGRLPRPTLPGASPPVGAEALESLPEGGFGWYLIHSLARDLAYAREASTNRLVLRIPYESRA